MLAQNLWLCILYAWAKNLRRKEVIINLKALLDEKMKWTKEIFLKTFEKFMGDKSYKAKTNISGEITLNLR